MPVIEHITLNMKHTFPRSFEKSFAKVSPDGKGGRESIRKAIAELVSAWADDVVVRSAQVQVQAAAPAAAEAGTDTGTSGT